MGKAIFFNDILGKVKIFDSEEKERKRSFMENKGWEKIIHNWYKEEYGKIIDEKANDKKTLTMQDETMVALSKVLEEKAKKIGYDLDYFTNKLYFYFGDFEELLSPETNAKIKESRDRCLQKQATIDKQKDEMEGLLEMAETYEQAKDILLQYGMINWDKKEESN